MKDLQITINIISLQEYMKELDRMYDTVEDLLKEFGVVAKQYVYAEGIASRHFSRTAVPVVAGNFEEAINTATHTILELYALDK